MSPWLAAASWFLESQDYFIPNLCSIEPPDMPEWTADEIARVLVPTGGRLDPALSVKLATTAQRAAWFEFCECNTGVSPTVPVESPPAGAPVEYGTPGVGTGQLVEWYGDGLGVMSFGGSPMLRSNNGYWREGTQVRHTRSDARSILGLGINVRTDTTVSPITERTIVLELRADNAGMPGSIIDRVSFPGYTSSMRALPGLATPIPVSAPLCPTTTVLTTSYQTVWAPFSSALPASPGTLYWIVANSDTGQPAPNVANTPWYGGNNGDTSATTWVGDFNTDLQLNPSFPLRKGFLPFGLVLEVGGSCSTSTGVECCPPDPTLMTRMDRLAAQLSDIQAMFSSQPLATLASQAISGEGTASLVSGTRGVSVELDEIPPWMGQDADANPDLIYGAGTLRWSDGVSWTAAQRIDAGSYWLPSPPGAVSVSWSLPPGLTATLRMRGWGD